MKNSPQKSSNQGPSTLVSYRSLFRYASKKEKWMMVIGSIAALVNGAGLPVMSLVMGDLSNDFVASDNYTKTALKYSLYFLYIGIGTLVTSYISFWFWMTVGESLGLKFRKAYFKSLVKQNIAFYDEINPNEVSSRVSNECFQIQQGIGEKVATFLYSLAMSLSGYIIGYTKGWQLALVLTACIPCMGIAATIFLSSTQKMERIRNEAYAKAGAIAEESLNAIRTLTALCGQRRESTRYHERLSESKKILQRVFLWVGIAMGLLQFFMAGTWALGFFFGSRLIENSTINPVSDAPYNVGDILSIFFAVLMGNSAVGQVSPAFKAFSSAREAGTRAFKIIDRKSDIDIDDPKGVKPTKVEGEFSFEKVEFAYPMKKEKMVLKGVSFNIHKNQKTAFVGESGCGKTTSMQLIERFYDITGGSIKLDGVELRDLNLFWLRSQIGYVGQEPVLFATTIRENMLFAKENATDEEIWEALKKANAYDFINTLPKKLDTYVGMSGTQLSGGQKQRLAIARAILKNPPILLLDEATSALDRKNEMEIQKTLDEISGGRTTIVIAHRLSTIQNADHIIVFDQGKIVEEGKHADLVAKKGKYYELQFLQLAQKTESQDSENQGKESNKDEKNHKNQFEADNKELAIVTPKLNEEILSRPVRSNKKKTENKKYSLVKNVARLYNLLGPDRKWFIFGNLANIVVGALFPLLSIYMSNMLGVLAFPDSPSFRDDSNRYCLYFFINGLVGLVFQTVVVAVFTELGENLTIKLRRMTFEKLLKMPIGWYDDPTNTPGGLNAKLSTDCIQVNTLIGVNLPLIIQAISTLSTGIIISFMSSWRLTLCAILYIPILVYACLMQGRLGQGFSAKTDEAFQEAGSFISEAVVNMRTVASFGKEDKLIENFNHMLLKPVNNAIKKGHDSGLVFGIAQFALFFDYSYIFLIGGALMQGGYVEYSDMFRSIFAILFACFSTGQMFQFMGEVGEAQKAATNLFELLDRKPEIDIDDPAQDIKTPIKGEVEFRNIWFKYPTREKQILRGFNLKINTSNKVALVGPSGCGKSTLIGLLLRFYDPQQGEILVDGVDIKKYDLQHLRRSFGYVSQEPTLFNDTIEENIKYTKADATDAEIRQSAIEANCLKFIEANEFESLDLDPEAAKKYGTGFKRVVGPKGSQISGGQKQRIAIARAILPKPNILLLDEATSALDAENEKIVQESLDKIMKGKTSIIVAHRISTIKDSDQILVFNEGVVVEKGNYEELVRQQGFFYKLERGLPI